MLHSLLPIKLTQDDPSHKTVEELAEVLDHAIKNKDIRNVALTGPFGSGKSSIIQTLMEEHNEFNYLPLSLATLQADSEGESEKENKAGNNEEKEKRTEALNRKIEYSILQQLIYKEKSDAVPNSRFRRIIHIEKKHLIRYSLGIVGFIIAFLIVFEPSFAKVETLYEFFDFGKCNIVFDLFSAIYLCFCVFWVFWYIIKSYANSKLNKLNLKDGDIEIKEENSIFNKHLDEILYFFQVTNYNVVIIEDLDRFDTESIYLKLRELNQLINESKIVERHIVFLYAIKDDVFENEDRTKFFDYITTVIPVINPSNSKAKLKAALKERGFDENEIPDDDLSEMAFFIQDMRILTNIANEYSQYRQKLCSPDKKNLDPTKLLAMIVYKNYFPKDFANLHRREGLVYQCLNMKQQFVAEALKALDDKKKELEDAQKMQEANNHLKEKELRFLFLYKLSSQLNPRLATIRLNNSNYTIEQISENVTLFSQLLSQDKVTFSYYGPYNSTSSNTKTINVSNFAKSEHLQERMSLITASSKIISQKEAEFQKEKLKIQSLKFNQLIRQYNLGETESYKKMNLSPLMDVFLRRGYIDEEYYDYISYFYPGMVSLADRDLLLSMKRQIKQDYTYHIDKVENFVKELKVYMFEHDAILNNDLLDYVARKANTNQRDMFTLMMKRLEREGAPLDFLSQYYQFGKQQNEVFSNFVEWDNKRSWQMIEDHTKNDEKQLLREAWFKFSKEVTSIQKQWLNNNYSFISTRVENIGLPKCKNLIRDCLFTKLDNSNEKLLTEAINQCCYKINKENLCVIANCLNKNSVVDPNNLNLTRITDTNHTAFIKRIKDTFSAAFTCFSSSCKDESAENNLYILNSKDISSEQKIPYLNDQQNTIADFTGIDEACWEIAIKSKIVDPTWKNIDTYFNKHKTITEALLEYIKKYHSKLEVPCTDDIGSKEALFEELLGTNDLDVESYRSICKAFDNVFDGYDELSQLKAERLGILLNNNKIAFSEENTKILQNTSFYAEYLIHYHKEFIGNLDKSYNIDVNCASRLLDSEKFSLQEKRKIIDILPSNVFVGSPTLSDRAIQVLLSSKDISIGQEKLNDLLKTAKNEEYKVYLVVQMLSNYSYNNENIPSLLSLLGGTYDDIAERKKRPVIENNGWNRALLSKLVEIGFISSTTDEKDGIRVNPKRV